MAKHLHKGDDTSRRKKITAASRARDAGLLPQLLARLDGNESYDNKRHIVLALGNIGGSKAEEKLISMLASQHGLILGEIAQSLGKLGSRRSIPALKVLLDHESEWIRQNVHFALRKLTNDDERE